MMLRRVGLSSLFIALIGLAYPAAAQEQGLEATIAPVISWGLGGQEGVRSRYGLEFYRISSGPSLLINYGTGAEFTDISATLRMANHFDIFNQGRSNGIIWGLGVAVAYSSGIGGNSLFDAGDDNIDSFTTLKLNPFLRYLVDFTGFEGAFLELGYEFPFYVHSDGSDSLKKNVRQRYQRFVVGLGVSFEVERPRRR